MSIVIWLVVINVILFTERISLKTYSENMVVVVQYFKDFYHAFQ